jgi:hypothetical protein
MDDHEEHEEFGLFELLLRAVDGTISDAQFARLEELLTASPGAVEDYVRFIMINASLYQSKETPFTALPPTAAGAQEVDQALLRAIEHDEQAAMASVAEQASWEEKARIERIKRVAEALFERFTIEERRRQEELAYKRYRANRRRLIVGAGSLAVLLVVTVFIGLMDVGRQPPRIPTPAPLEQAEDLVNNTGRPPPIPTPEPPRVLARIADSLNAQWQQRELSTEPGTELTASLLQLRSGLVQIMFNCGAGVLIEAPASARIEAADQIWLGEGRLVARAANEAVGFTVRTLGATLVDYGTEFGVLVSDTGQTETHVFEGQVDVRSGPNARVFNESRRLKASEACTVDREGKLSQAKLAANPGLFQRYMPSPYELAVLESRPIGYWRFDPNAPNRPLDVLNRGASAGHYVGPVQFTDGPCLGGGKKAGALQFEANDSHAVIPNVTVPYGVPKTTGFTHVMWVRADVIRTQGILAITGQGVAGRILCMTDDGRFCHYYLGSGGNFRAPATSKTSAQPGRWYHVVVMRSAYDDKRLFVNGVEEGVAELSSNYLSDTHETVYVGTVGQSVASLKGAISEVATYNRALKPREIEKLYMSVTEQ